MRHSSKVIVRAYNRARHDRQLAEKHGHASGPIMAHEEWWSRQVRGRQAALTPMTALDRAPVERHQKAVAGQQQQQEQQQQQLQSQQSRWITHPKSSQTPWPHTTKGFWRVARK